MASLEKSKEWQRVFRSTKNGYLRSNLAKIKSRCKKNNIPFNLTYEFLDSITTDTCPIFGVEFIWRTSGAGRGVYKNTPTLDRVIPKLGYVQGNVVFISHLANAIKQDVTEAELYAVADWLHDKRKEVLNAFPGQSAPLPTPGARISKKDPEPGATHGAGPGQDCDGAQHHQAELFGADPGGCA